MGWLKQSVSIDGQEYRAAIKTLGGHPVRMEVYGASVGDIKPGSAVSIGKASFLCAKPKQREDWLEIALKPAPKQKAAKKEAKSNEPDRGSKDPGERPGMDA